MKQIPREPPPTVSVRPRVSSNFYAMLQYSMTNKVSLTRRCCLSAESSTSMTTSRAIAVRGFLGARWFRWRHPLSLPVQNMTGTTELFSTCRHSVYVIACVFTSLFPLSLFHVIRALIQNNCFSSLLLEHLPPVAIPSRGTFTVSVRGCVQSAMKAWLVSCCEPV